MKTRWTALAALAVALGTARLAAQSYSGIIESANCSAVSGWAWDSTRPNTAISVDLYDGSVPIATVVAGNYRSDLYADGYGNGDHGFSFTIPPSLKDGRQHVVDGYFSGTKISLSYTQSFTCPAGTTGYVYYYNDSLTSINSSNWIQNGSVSATSGGLTASSSNGGSLISKVAVPDGSSDYEVKTTLTLTAAGGTYVMYLRATNNAMSGPSPTGTFYSVEVTPSMSGTVCSSATIVINKSISGSITQLGSVAVTCHNGMVIRAWIQGSSIGVDRDIQPWLFATDSAITSGSAGVGAYGTASGNSIAAVALGPADRIAPQAPNSATFATTVLPTRMDVRFAPVADDPNGTGIAIYFLYRDGSWQSVSSTPEFTDESITAGSSHTYTVYATDFRDNVSAGTSFSVTAPPAGAVDPRRVGLRPTGTYWGASPEQIDVLSGNLNLTLPLLAAQGRNGWTVPFNLTYNSQNWRADAGGIWNLGLDVGYGYGWKLSAGALTPYYVGVWSVDHYDFVDATGAEYRLNQNNNGIWSSTESLYIWYDSNANILHFRDGSFWVMGCTSAGTEPDAGTMYPTTMENSNGNQILAYYFAGANLPNTNSSARIQYIQDVRAINQQNVTYTFIYTTDTVPHLTSIQNWIGTSEGYQFAFLGSQALVDPFTGTGYNYSGGLIGLQSVTAIGIGMQHSFTYDQSGEMTQAIFPYGGYFKYNYGSVAYSSGFTQREITSRIMSKDGTQASELTYPFTHESSTNTQPVHQFTTMADPAGVGQKHWIFSQSGANIGLTTSYQGQQLPGPTTMVENDFTWTQDANNNFYIGSTLTTWTYAPGPYQTQSKIAQTVDVYGNVTQVQKYQFGSLSSPARTYNYSYLNSSNYTNRYIYNRLATATVTDGTNTIYLASNGYDSNSQYVPPFTTNPQEWDTSYASQTYRGNLTSSTTPSGNSAYSYDQAGNVAYATANGVTTSVTTGTTTNFAAPTQLTVGSLTSSMSWSSFLGLSNATGPNGDSVSTTYDTFARPSSTTSPFGATTTYTYNSPPYNTSNPPTVTMTTNGRWTKDTLDGFGRTIQVQTGDANGTKSSSESVYGPCACSPLGKLIQKSNPHVPNASSPTLTTYTYDGIGRTLSAATVGSDTQGTTTYVYYMYPSTDLYTLVYDPSGKDKLYITDAFNNLAVVGEPPTSSEPNGAYSYYGYDLLDHLTSVYMQRTAGTQTRSFVYTGNLLTSATNPENGTVTYTYNSYNKVASKTDAKGQQIVYTYDTLARLTKVQKYPQGTSYPEDTCQQENYYYDANTFQPNNSNYSNYNSGRLTAVQYYGGSTTYASSNPNCDTTFTETYGYNQAGGKIAKGLQVTRSLVSGNPNLSSTWQYVPTTADLESTYAFDNEGRITAVQYPSYGPPGCKHPVNTTGPREGWGT